MLYSNVLQTEFVENLSKDDLINLVVSFALLQAEEDFEKLEKVIKDELETLKSQSI